MPIRFGCRNLLFTTNIYLFITFELLNSWKLYKAGFNKIKNLIWKKIIIKTYFFVWTYKKSICFFVFFVKTYREWFRDANTKLIVWFFGSNRFLSEEHNRTSFSSSFRGWEVCFALNPTGSKKTKNLVWKPTYSFMYNEWVDV